MNNKTIAELEVILMDAQNKYEQDFEALSKGFWRQKRMEDLRDRHRGPKQEGHLACKSEQTKPSRTLVKSDGDCDTFVPEQTNVEKITTERGKNYGKPIDHFNTSQAMFEEWEARTQHSGTFSCMDIEKQRAVRHGVRFLIDKITRAAENPLHKDNWDDIEGYAWCIKNALEMEPDRETD